MEVVEGLVDEDRLDHHIEQEDRRSTSEQDNPAQEHEEGKHSLRHSSIWPASAHYSHTAYYNGTVEITDSFHL